MYNVTFKRVRITILAVEKQYHIFLECVFVPLGTQHAKHLRRVILPSVASLTVPYFSTLSQKLHDFREKAANIKCVFRFSL
jgi:hypothetical protein